MIGRILASYPAPFRPIRPPEYLGNAGGFSGSEFWRFPADAGPLALRAWPIDGPDESRLLAIHRDLLRAGGLGFIPVPLGTSDGRTFLRDRETGRLCELTRWLPGSPDGARPPDDRHIEAAFSGLARFHQFLQAGSPVPGPAPGIARRLAELQRCIAIGDAEIGRRIRAGLGGEARRDALDWLDETVRLARVAMGELSDATRLVVPIQRCLLDLRPDHFLFEHGQLTGLVDFGAMGEDSVAADLARIRLEWLGTDANARAASLAAYETIRPLSAGDRTLIEVFEFANALLGGWRWVEWSVFEGRTFREPQAVSKGLRRAVERLGDSRAIRSASAGLRPG